MDTTRSSTSSSMCSLSHCFSDNGGGLPVPSPSVFAPLYRRETLERALCLRNTRSSTLLKAYVVQHMVQGGPLTEPSWKRLASVLEKNAIIAHRVDCSVDIPNTKKRCKKLQRKHEKKRSPRAACAVSAGLFCLSYSTYYGLYALQESVDDRTLPAILLAMAATVLQTCVDCLVSRCEKHIIVQSDGKNALLGRAVALSVQSVCAFASAVPKSPTSTTAVEPALRKAICIVSASAFGSAAAGISGRTAGCCQKKKMFNANSDSSKWQEIIDAAHCPARPVTVRSMCRALRHAGNLCNTVTKNILLANCLLFLCGCLGRLLGGGPAVWVTCMIASALNLFVASSGSGSGCRARSRRTADRSSQDTEESGDEESVAVLPRVLYSRDRVTIELPTGEGNRAHSRQAGGSGSTRSHSARLPPNTPHTPGNRSVLFFQSAGGDSQSHSGPDIPDPFSDLSENVRPQGARCTNPLQRSSSHKKRAQKMPRAHSSPQILHAQVVASHNSTYGCVLPGENKSDGTE